MRFVDINVLIYAASPSADEAGERRRTQDLLREGSLQGGAGSARQWGVFDEAARAAEA
ncbi:MAG: hypothetical protein OXH75_04760 [Acidobacteria bacterium]|nr:hypothetical protein [Acidobacteriota bacterium]